MLQWTLGCRYLFETVILFPLAIYPEMELLDHMVALFLVFWGTSRLFSIVAVPINIPTNSAWEFSFPPHPHQHLLSLVFLIIAIITDVKWYITVVLICIFLMISVTKHLFINLLAICILPLEKCLQTYLGDTVGSVPDNHNKASITIKQVTQMFWFPSAYKSYVSTIP